MQARKPSLRVTLRALCAILLGLLTTIAVAAACCLWMIPTEVRDASAVSRNGIPLNSVFYSFGLAAKTDDGIWRGINCFTHRALNSPGRQRTALSRFSFNAGQSWEFFDIRSADEMSLQTSVLYDEHFRNKPWPVRFEKEVVLLDRAGWPFQAFSGRLRFVEKYKAPLQSIESSWSISLPDDTTMPTHWASLLPARNGIEAVQSLRLLPLRPIWSGICINTATFAAIWAALLWGLPSLFRTARATCRRRRGLCLFCAYNRCAILVDAPCPECGRAPVTRPTHTTSDPSKE